MVEVDLCRYCPNKHDPPGGNIHKSDSHSDDHDVPMATGVMPTLHPKSQLKFPKFPVQATQQKDFNI